jgi:hypothetical protein
MRVDEERHNHCVNLTVRPVTSLAKSGKRRTGPARRLRMRSTNGGRLVRETTE